MGFGYLELVNGLLSIAVICCFTFVGLKIALIYKKNKDKVYLLVGLAWMLLASPWYGSGTSFIVALFNYGQGLTPIPLLYFSLVVPFIPIALTILVTSMTEIMFRPNRWIIRAIFVIFAIIMEIVFIFLMIYDPTGVIDLKTPVNAEYHIAILIYILFATVIVMLIGILLSRSSIKLGTAESKVRGYFLLVAFVFFVLGALFDSTLKNLITAVPLLILLPRGLLLTSALCFYLGFVTPNFIKKRLKTA